MPSNPISYATSIARPHMFRDYLIEQLGYLVRDYKVEISVSRSASEIPYPYVLDGSEDLQLNGKDVLEGGSGNGPFSLRRCMSSASFRAWASN
mgnify:CR=1 FL=1